MTNQNQAPVKQAKKDMTFEVNGQEITLSQKIVRDYLVRGNAAVTDQEVSMFIQLCRYQELNPFINEAYIVKFGNQPASLIVSKEAFMKRAENNSQYNGMKAGIIVEREKQLVELDGAIKLRSDELIGGWARVYRKDRDQPVEVKIDFQEFSKSQATWKTSPMNMIRKTAVVNALREAFPNALGAMYTEDDSQPDSYNVPIDITNEVNEKANKQTLDFDQQPQQVKPVKDVTPDPVPVENNIVEDKPAPEPAIENSFDDENPPF